MADDAPNTRLRSLLPALADGMRVRVRGDCMAPMIDAGSVIALQPGGRLWPGDVVLVATSPSGYRLHRVLGLYRKHRAWWVVTQGDRLNTPDAAVRREAIVGKARCPVGSLARLRAGGRFLRFALSRITLQRRRTAGSPSTT